MHNIVVTWEQYPHSEEMAFWGGGGSCHDVLTVISNSSPWRKSSGVGKMCVGGNAEKNSKSKYDKNSNIWWN